MFPAPPVHRRLSKAERELVNRGLGLYSEGWFPMADETGCVEWVQPQERAIVPLDSRFHISRSLHKTLRRGGFVLSTDLAFAEVIGHCASVPRSDGHGTWLDEEIIQLFELFHRAGFAHSVEAWVIDGARARLVGGVYGVGLGGVFCAESMFCLPEHGGTDASKVALVALRGLIRSLGYSLLDAQIINPHTARFGVYEIPRLEYVEIMREHLRRPPPAWPDAGGIPQIVGPSGEGSWYP